MISIQYLISLLGMLSKSRSHVLRLSAVLHVLFYHSNDDQIPDIVSEEAIIAAINFVQLSCEQTAIISGRGSIKDIILKCQTGTDIHLLYLCAFRF